MKTIPYGRHFVDKKDYSYIKKIFFSDYLTTGPETIKFEKNLCKITNAKYSLSCNSGTSGLLITFLALGIKKNDNIIMPSVNFIAAYNMCSFLGANIFLSDVDKFSGAMTYENINNCIKKNKLKKIKLILLMHLGGQTHDLEKIVKIKNKFNCNIVEDACHALGGTYQIKNKKYKVGCSKHSIASIFSFHPLKSISTGEGGAITINNLRLFNKMKLIRSHGIKRSDYTKYDVSLIGFNFRLADINCALGNSQIKKIGKFIKKRKLIAKNYLNKLKDLRDYVVLPKNYFLNTSAWHLFIISIKFSKLKTSKDDFINYMKKKKIKLQFHYIPINKFSIFKKKYSHLKNSQYYMNNSISLPIYYLFNIKKQNYVINCIKGYIKNRKC